MSNVKDDGTVEDIPRPWRYLTVMFRGRPRQVALEVVDTHGHELDGPAASAWRQMVLAAKNDGVVLEINTAWRSGEYQKRLRDRYEAYRDYLAEFEAWKDLGEVGQPPKAVPFAALAAQPGWSEHEIGWAVDIKDAVEAKHPVTLWLNANAERLGWARTVSGELWHVAYRPAPAVA